jgi:3-hydroxybutyryl-CoA dehydrogenase
MAKELSSVAVVGGGFMGAGIAVVSAIAGLPVVVRELPQFRDAARERVEHGLAGEVKRGTLDDTARAEAAGRITFTSELTDLADVDLVIEAVPEVLDLKVGLMAELDKIVGPQTVLATNTSSIPIAQLAAAAQNPGRVIGIHFFSPVPMMRLVEIVVALDTAEDTVEAALGLAERLGKYPIRTKDRSGFVVNFLLSGYLMSAMRMYDEGFASREDIDEGMRLGAGHPMGPLRLSDFIGLDVLLSVCNSLYEEFKREEFAPPPLLKRMVAAGRLGRKAGRGFYEYGAQREPARSSG